MRATSPASAQTLAVHTARDVGEPDVRPVIGRAAVAAAVAGNALEFYDFVIYAYFAVYIGRAFFPVGGEFGSLLLAAATFGVGLDRKSVV